MEFEYPLLWYRLFTKEYVYLFQNLVSCIFHKYIGILENTIDHVEVIYRCSCVPFSKESQLTYG